MDWAVGFLEQLIATCLKQGFPGAGPLLSRSAGSLGAQGKSGDAVAESRDREPTDGLCRPLSSFPSFLLSGCCPLGAPLLERGVRTGSGEIQICESSSQSAVETEDRAAVRVLRQEAERLARCFRVRVAELTAVGHPASEA